MGLLAIVGIIGQKAIEMLMVMMMMITSMIRPNEYSNFLMGEDGNRVDVLPSWHLV